MEHFSDAELVRMARQGGIDGSQAWAALFRRHKNMVLRIVFNIVRRYELAADGLQKTFLSAYKNLNRFTGGEKFARWIAVIAKRFALNLYRDEKRHDCVSLDNLVSVSDPRAVIAEDQLLLRDRQGAVQRWIEQMPGHMQEIITLRYQGYLEYQAIADRLGIPVGTVMSRLHRAHKRLAKIIAEASDNGDQLSRHELATPW